MQTLSSMQRSGYVDKSFIIFFFLFFLYEPLTTIYLYLPPLFSLVLWIYAKGQKRILWFVYILLYSLDHNLGTLLLPLVLLFSARTVQKIERYIACTICLKVIGASFFYAYLLFTLLLYSSVLDKEIEIDYLLFSSYFLIDLLLVSLYEK